jgi:hypothetical protein
MVRFFGAAFGSYGSTSTIQPARNTSVGVLVRSHRGSTVLHSRADLVTVVGTPYRL